MKGKKWKNFMAKLYGWGAAVVIIRSSFQDPALAGSWYYAYHRAI
jgi:hypothetical protein